MPATGKRASYNKTPDKASPFAAPPRFWRCAAAWRATPRSIQRDCHGLSRKGLKVAPHKRPMTETDFVLLMDLKLAGISALLIALTIAGILNISWPSRLLAHAHSQAEARIAAMRAPARS